jgi:hypothetical protein
MQIKVSNLLCAHHLGENKSTFDQPNKGKKIELKK